MPKGNSEKNYAVGRHQVGNWPLSLILLRCILRLQLVCCGHWLTGKFHFHTKQSYSTVVLYSRDHGGLGLSAQKYHPKSSLIFTIQQFGSIG